MVTNVNLKTAFNAAPLTPGVYFFKNRQGRLLYIGKAAHLRSRLRSHFRNGHKDRVLYEQVARIEWQEAGSEIEALILEALLIKKHQPPYNVVLRDDKNYFFVGFTRETYPKMFVTHQPLGIRDQELGIRSKFKIQNQNDKGLEPLSNPIKPSPRQTAPKSDFVAASNFSYIGPFTSGRALREALRLLQRVFPYCTCKERHKRPCMRFQLERCLGICCLRPDRLPQYETLFIGANGSLERTRRGYRRNVKNLKEILEGRVPRLLKSLNREMAEASRRQDFEQAAKLRDQVASFKWVLAHAHVLTRTGLGSEENKAGEGITALKALLAIDEAPRRIESYDISNIQGNFAVGSMIVFESGVPKKSDYRKFRIRTIKSANDVAMHREIFSRRLKHPEWPLPDVIIVDGGIAQVNAYQRTISANHDDRHEMRNQALYRPVVLGFTKDHQHKAHHLTLPDKRTIPFENLPESLKNLLTHIDNEAHRFAISYYRKLHRKKLKERI